MDEGKLTQVLHGLADGVSNLATSTPSGAPFVVAGIARLKQIIYEIEAAIAGKVEEVEQKLQVEEAADVQPQSGESAAEDDPVVAAPTEEAASVPPPVSPASVETPLSGGMVAEPTPDPAVAEAPPVEPVVAPEPPVTPPAEPVAEEAVSGSPTA